MPAYSSLCLLRRSILLCRPTATIQQQPSSLLLAASSAFTRLCWLSYYGGARAGAGGYYGAGGGNGNDHRSNDDDDDDNTIPASTSTPLKHFSGDIPTDGIKKRFMRSSGPGGQHVNMVNTKCEIRFKLSDAQWLSKEIRKEFRTKFSRYVSDSDDVIINSDKTRSQVENLADCFEKLRQMLEECVECIVQASRSPSEEDIKILTQRKDESARRRLENKRKQSAKKKMRSSSSNLDF